MQRHSGGVVQEYLQMMSGVQLSSRAAAQTRQFKLCSQLTMVPQTMASQLANLGNKQ